MGCGSCYAEARKQRWEEIIFDVHQQKFRLHQMRQPCILTQETSDLHPQLPEHPDAKYSDLVSSSTRSPPNLISSASRQI